MAVKYFLQIDKDKYDYIWKQLKQVKTQEDLLELYKNNDYLVHHTNSKYHNETLYNHVLQMYNAVSNTNLYGKFVEMLQWAILFHDIGKFCTETYYKYTHYYNHEIVSAHLFKRWVETVKLEWYNDRLYYYELAYIILNHMRMFGEHTEHIIRGLGSSTNVLLWLHELDKCFSGTSKSISYIPTYDYVSEIIPLSTLPVFNPNSKNVIVLTGIPGAGKTTLRKKLASYLHPVIINYDTYRKHNLNLQDTTTKILKLYRANKKLKNLIIDNTNINLKHYKTNRVLEFNKSPYNLYFVNIIIPFSLSLERRSNFPFKVLVAYHGRYTPSFLIHKVSNATHILIKGV